MLRVETQRWWPWKPLPVQINTDAEYWQKQHHTGLFSAARLQPSYSEITDCCYSAMSTSTYFLLQLMTKGGVVTAYLAKSWGEGSREERVENDDGFIQVPDKHTLQWNNRNVMLTSWKFMCVCKCEWEKDKYFTERTVWECVCLPRYQSPEVEQGHWLVFSPLTSHLTLFVSGLPPLYLELGGLVAGGTPLEMYISRRSVSGLFNQLHVTQDISRFRAQGLESLHLEITKDAFSFIIGMFCLPFSQ